MSGPLAGTTLLDFTRHLPGPYCTDIFRRLGARVLKIEPPDGDPTRWLPPFEGDVGALFRLINGGKESVVVDLKTSEGRAFVHRLAGACDVAVESYRPGVAAGFGIDAATLMAINPRLIHCSVSGFGSTSGRSSHDLNFVALAGLLDLQRDRDGRPVLPATQIGDMAGALFAAISILAALHERQTTGRGAAIDISMAAATRALMPTAEALYRGTSHTPETFWLTGAMPNYDIYRTRDGKYLSVAALEPQFWDAFCRAIGCPELIPRQYDEGARREIGGKLAGIIATRDRDEWERIFADIDACVEPVLSIEEAHARFGDPAASGPLATNFPAPKLEVGALGAALDAAADLAGLDAAEKKALRKSRAFAPGSRLAAFMKRSVMRYRGGSK
ncbi:MAG TPA: CoA transferase [Thermoanaerobaculia bacterium]|nr:CoA transferase [Thermoanaerobaculia bacterium]